MRYVNVILCALVCVLCLGLSAHAADDSDSGGQTEETNVTVPVVALDPQSIQDIADAVNATEPTGNDVDIDETTPIPVVNLSLDSIGALSQAVSDAMAASAASDVPSPLAAVSGVSGGYYFVADCALGSSVKFWVPADFASGSIAFDGNNLINMTNSSIYLLSDSGFTNYTIYAPRFSHFQYRRDNTSGYSDLSIRSVSDSNIDFLDDTPQAVPDAVFWVVLISVVILGFLILAFIRR